MIYTIEETNQERQHLLAQFLEPLSLHALENFSLNKGSQILDVGCGLGDTTHMLSNFFTGTFVTGLDQDDALIKAASATKELYSNIKFLSGNVLELPFEANSFDFVFCRYLLHHIPDACAALEEMKRICKRGGVIFVQEPDLNSIQSYPASWAYPKLKEFANVLFADAVIGRKLIGYFRALKLEKITHDIQAILADHSSVLKKFYSMTGASLGKALLQNKLIDEKGLNEWISELEKMEHNPEAIVLMHPTIAVWGVKVC